MPELPEVEVVRRGLETFLKDATITRAEVRRDSAVRHHFSPDEFAFLVADRRVTAVVRRGKFMWWELSARDDEDTPVALSAHLGMSGQFRAFDDAGQEPHKHCRTRFHLGGSDAAVMDFHDQRTFGYLRVEPMVPTVDGGAAGQGTPTAWLPQSVAHIGRDALDPLLSPDAYRSWRSSSRGIKQVLLDQQFISGVGNIYADEALWAARVHPQSPANSLSFQALARVFEAARTVMAAALAVGGTSFDDLYVNVNGESGYFARGLEAYGRAGEPCSRCGVPLEKATIGGRGTHWCPRCQRRIAR